jgi:hypothetical protein
MRAHTPGPWTEFEDSDSHDIIAPDGTHIARMEPRNGQPVDHAMQVADAHLIAAAPALLEALETILKQHSVICEDTANDLIDDDCAKARAAIAQAKGGE